MLQELPSILVVSASNSGRKNLARCLGNLAYRVLWEEQSRDGLAVLSGESDKIVAVILDKDMQGMSIEQWAAAARRMTSRIAFLLWAPNAEPGEALDRVAAVARVHAVLLSPVDTDSLDKAISQAISLRVSYG